jgi:putative oxidoreductase
MKRLLFGTWPHWSGPILRLVLGVVFFAHGAQKALGWFGGQGWGATVQGFVGMGMPEWQAHGVIVAEFFGAIGLLVGFFTRLAAAGIVTVMVGAIVKVHLANGFFMNWHGTQKGEGYEYHLLAIGIGVALFFSGAGAASIDHCIAGRPPSSDPEEP